MSLISLLLVFSVAMPVVLGYNATDYKEGMGMISRALGMYSSALGLMLEAFA